MTREQLIEQIIRIVTDSNKTPAFAAGRIMYHADKYFDEQLAEQRKEIRQLRAALTIPLSR